MGMAYTTAAGMIFVLISEWDGRRHKDILFK